MHAALSTLVPSTINRTSAMNRGSWRTGDGRARAADFTVQSPDSTPCGSPAFRPPSLSVFAGVALLRHLRVPMKILLLGASGRTGRIFLSRALDHGHSVTAVVRQPGAISEGDRPGLRMVVADPLSGNDLVPLLSGQDAVVSCLGQTSHAAPYLLRDAAIATEAAIARSNPNLRYLTISQALLFPTRNPLVLLIRLIYRRVQRDSSAMEHVVRAGPAPWTIVRPTRLVDSKGPPGCTAATDLRPKASATLRRTDLADFLLEEATSPHYVRQIVGLTSGTPP